MMTNPDEASHVPTWRQEPIPCGFSNKRFLCGKIFNGALYDSNPEITFTFRDDHGGRI